MRTVHLTSLPERHHHFVGTIEKFGAYYKVKLKPNLQYIIAGPAYPGTHTWSENLIGLIFEFHCPEGCP